MHSLAFARFYKGAYHVKKRFPLTAAQFFLLRSYLKLRYANSNIFCQIWKKNCTKFRQKCRYHKLDLSFYPYLEVLKISQDVKTRYCLGGANAINRINSSVTTLLFNNLLGLVKTIEISTNG